MSNEAQHKHTKAMNVIQMTPEDANKARELQARIAQIELALNAIAGLNPLTTLTSPPTITPYGQATREARAFMAAERDALRSELDALIEMYDNAPECDDII